MKSVHNRKFVVVCSPPGQTLALKDSCTVSIIFCVFRNIFTPFAAFSSVSNPAASLPSALHRTQICQRITINMRKKPHRMRVAAWLRKRAFEFDAYGISNRF